MAKKDEPVISRNCGGSGTVVDRDANGKPISRGHAVPVADRVGFNDKG